MRPARGLRERRQRGEARINTLTLFSFTAPLTSDTLKTASSSRPRSPADPARHRGLAGGASRLAAPAQACPWPRPRGVAGGGPVPLPAGAGGVAGRW